ncbi:Uncharacterised protein g2686 [Pycnogonum litorale]
MVHMNTLLLLVFVSANISLANGRATKQHTPIKDVENSSKTFPEVKSRTLLSDPTKKWPNATVYYVIPRGRHHCKKLFRREMRNIQNKTCIKFIKRSAEPNYVEFVYKPGFCGADLGMIGGKQEVDYYIECCVKRIIQHELLHVLGVIHEHQRPDRDQYVNVNYNNIQTGYRKFYGPYGKGDVVTYNQSFDFDSVMIYSSNTWQKPNKLTMERKDTNLPYFIHQGNEMSQKDWYKLKKHYCS